MSRSVLLCKWIRSILFNSIDHVLKADNRKKELIMRGGLRGEGTSKRRRGKGGKEGWRRERGEEERGRREGESEKQRDT